MREIVESAQTETNIEYNETFDKLMIYSCEHGWDPPSHRLLRPESITLCLQVRVQHPRH